jgi:hypothetical protein
VVQVFVLSRKHLFFVLDLVQGRLIVFFLLVLLLFLDFCFILIERLWLAAPLFLLWFIVRVVLIFSFCVVIGTFILELTVLLVTIFVLFFG